MRTGYEFMPPENYCVHKWLFPHSSLGKKLFFLSWERSECLETSWKEKKGCYVTLQATDLHGALSLLKHLKKSDFLRMPENHLKIIGKNKDKLSHKIYKSKWPTMNTDYGKIQN